MELELELASKSNKDRIAMLEDAIRAHRFSIGTGYHYHSFKTVHAANLELWSFVEEKRYSRSEEETESSLVRPAMMEDDI